MTLVREHVPVPPQELPVGEGAPSEPAEEVKDRFEAEHTRALQIDALLRDGIVPSGISVATRVRILGKVIDNDLRFSKTMNDSRTFEQKRQVTGYYEQKATLCLRAIAKARKARGSSGIL